VNALITHIEGDKRGKWPLLRFKNAIFHPRATMAYVRGGFTGYWSYIISQYLSVARSECSSLAEILSTSEEEIDLYYRELASDPLLSELASAFGSRARTTYGELDTAPVLYPIVRAVKPDTVVETGTAAGLSSSMILQALNRNMNGHLYSIDMPLETVAWTDGTHVRKVRMSENRASGWAIPQRIRSRWTMIEGRSADILPDLVKKFNVDLFLHDSDHSYENMSWELETVRAHLSPRGLMLADDADIHPRFGDFCHLHEMDYRSICRGKIAILTGTDNASYASRIKEEARS
jgi:predicted O-methyltransferase YrrM